MALSVNESDPHISLVWNKPLGETVVEPYKLLVDFDYWKLFTNHPLETSSKGSL